MWIEPEPQHCKVHSAYCIREAAKKVLLNGQAINRGGGFKGPLRKKNFFVNFFFPTALMARIFFAASLSENKYLV